MYTQTQIQNNTPQEMPKLYIDVETFCAMQIQKKSKYCMHIYVYVAVMGWILNVSIGSRGHVVLEGFM